MNAGFAVVDVETTGLFPGSHRIAEIAVVHVEPDGTVGSRWETLVNPQRDLGPQHLHGIRAADILHAPVFGDIAHDVMDLLAGRVLVAHNVHFDFRFVSHELGRAGLELPFEVHDCLCTMKLARRYLPGAGRSLKDCCDSFGLNLENAHSAGDDAEAAARVLSNYLRMDSDNPKWFSALDRAYFASWPAVEPKRRQPALRRLAAEPQPHFLERLVSRLPEVAGPDEHNAYLAMLDRALMDRQISASEADGLVNLAVSLGISRITAEQLHIKYMISMLAAAWDDGVVTAEEEADLRIVGDLLDISQESITRGLVAPVAGQDAETGAAVQSLVLAAGDKVVLTGEMSRDRSGIEADLRAAGFVPHPAITKAVKLLVAADPDSLSGKAKKARGYGIPVVGENYLSKLLNT
ncbi:DNA polymerase III, epsilon subunit [Arthrobacter sp. 9AX]|uniref:exonuclease domain-containing protein n=1 Tax=Arthrobacter sp. 9AX TaxID=2653131 RepID=UPI0012F0695E|nr:exonuclease domain-containing protein [Arthrobacter sp. 9AX]VXC54141.1 DNA polymerase III, epsilon subunit [Arthrobacter sp. 9AX]